MQKSDSEIIRQFEPDFDQKEIDAVTDLLSSGDMLLEHKKTREFEKMFAEFVGAKYCITVTSGTTALYLASITVPTYPSNRVAIPDVQGIFLANALVQAYRNPVLFDVSKNGSLYEIPEGQNCFVVHANGRDAGYVSHEDCCQAISTHTVDSISCYSFASTKHLTTLGQGGAICCDDKERFDYFCKLKDQGRTDRQELKPMSDHYDVWGVNYKFTEAQAVFGLEQLKRLPKKLSKLESQWNMMNDILKDLEIFYPEQPYWYIDVFVDKPEHFISFLRTKNIIAKRYPKPLHTQPLYRTYGNFENSNNFYNHGVFLPSSTKLTEDQIHHICDSIKEFYH